jgi:hypothetical protein
LSSVRLASARDGLKLDDRSGTCCIAGALLDFRDGMAPKVLALRVVVRPRGLGVLVFGLLGEEGARFRSLSISAVLVFGTRTAEPEIDTFFAFPVKY